MRTSFLATAVMTATVVFGVQPSEAMAGGGGGAYLVVPVRNIVTYPQRTARPSGFTNGATRAPFGVTMGRGRALGYGFQTTNMGQNRNRRYQPRNNYRYRGGPNGRPYGGNNYYPGNFNGNRRR